MKFGMEVPFMEMNICAKFYFLELSISGDIGNEIIADFSNFLLTLSLATTLDRFLGGESKNHT